MSNLQKRGILVLFIILLSTLSVHALENTVFSDMDGDGDLDLYLETTLETQAGPSFVTRNATDGIGNVPNVTQGYFVDVDGDGDEDLYIVRQGFPNQLFRKDVGISFTNITNSVLGNNLTNDSTAPIGTAFADFDGDGDTDAFVEGTFFASVGSFADTNASALSNLDELPPLVHLTVQDVNLDTEPDIVGVATDGSIVLFLNIGDNNVDGVPEFYDATRNAQLLGITDVNHLDVADIDYGLAVNNTVLSFPFAGELPPFIYDVFQDIYLGRNGSNQLLIQQFAQLREPIGLIPGAAFYLPRFQDLSAFSGVDDPADTKQVIIEDFDSNGANDIYIGNSIPTDSIYLRNGSSWLMEFVNFTLSNVTINDTKLAQAADLDVDGDFDIGFIDDFGVFINSVISGSLPFGLGTGTDPADVPPDSTGTGVAEGGDFYSSFGNVNIQEQFIANAFTGTQPFDPAIVDYVIFEGSSVGITASEETIGIIHETGHWDSTPGTTEFTPGPITEGGTGPTPSGPSGGGGGGGGGASSSAATGTSTGCGVVPGIGEITCVFHSGVNACESIIQIAETTGFIPENCVVITEEFPVPGPTFDFPTEPEITPEPTIPDTPAEKQIKDEYKFLIPDYLIKDPEGIGYPETYDDFIDSGEDIENMEYPSGADWLKNDDIINGGMDSDEIGNIAKHIINGFAKENKKLTPLEKAGIPSPGQLVGGPLFPGAPSVPPGFTFMGITQSTDENGYPIYTYTVRHTRTGTTLTATSYNDQQSVTKVDAVNGKLTLGYVSNCDVEDVNRPGFLDAACSCWERHPATDMQANRITITELMERGGDIRDFCKSECKKRGYESACSTPAPTTPVQTISPTGYVTAISGWQFVGGTRGSDVPGDSIEGSEPEEQQPTPVPVGTDNGFGGQTRGTDVSDGEPQQPQPDTRPPARTAPPPPQPEPTVPYTPPSDLIETEEPPIYYNPSPTPSGLYNTGSGVTGFTPISPEYIRITNIRRNGVIEGHTVPTVIAGGIANTQNVPSIDNIRIIPWIESVSEEVEYVNEFGFPRTPETGQNIIWDGVKIPVPVSEPTTPRITPTGLDEFGRLLPFEIQAYYDFTKPIINNIEKELMPGANLEVTPYGIAYTNENIDALYPWPGQGEETGVAWITADTDGDGKTETFVPYDATPFEMNNIVSNIDTGNLIPTNTNKEAAKYNIRTGEIFTNADKSVYVIANIEGTVIDPLAPWPYETPTGPSKSEPAEIPDISLVKETTGYENAYYPGTGKMEYVPVKTTIDYTSGTRVTTKETTYYDGTIKVETTYNGYKRTVVNYPDGRVHVTEVENDVEIKIIAETDGSVVVTERNILEEPEPHEVIEYGPGEELDEDTEEILRHYTYYYIDDFEGFDTGDDIIGGDFDDGIIIEDGEPGEIIGGDDIVLEGEPTPQAPYGTGIRPGLLVDPGRDVTDFGDGFGGGFGGNIFGDGEEEEPPTVFWHPEPEWKPSKPPLPADPIGPVVTETEGEEHHPDGSGVVPVKTKTTEEPAEGKGVKIVEKEYPDGTTSKRKVVTGSDGKIDEDDVVTEFPDGSKRITKFDHKTGKRRVIFVDPDGTIRVEDRDINGNLLYPAKTRRPNDPGYSTAKEAIQNFETYITSSFKQVGEGTEISADYKIPYKYTIVATPEQANFINEDVVEAEFAASFSNILFPYVSYETELVPYTNFDTIEYANFIAEAISVDEFKTDLRKITQAGAISYGVPITSEDGETDVLADGTQLGIRDILATGEDVQKSIVQFYLGANNYNGATLFRLTDSETGEIKALRVLRITNIREGTKDIRRPAEIHISTPLLWPYLPITFTASTSGFILPGETETARTFDRSILENIAFNAPNRRYTSEFELQFTTALPKDKFTTTLVTGPDVISGGEGGDVIYGGEGEQTYTPPFTNPVKQATKNEDGTVQVTWTTGKQTTYPTGTTVKSDGQGGIIIETPDGRDIIALPDNPNNPNDGQVIERDAKGKVIITAPDGKIIEIEGRTLQGDLEANPQLPATFPAGPVRAVRTNAEGEVEFITNDGTIVPAEGARVFAGDDGSIIMLWPKGDYWVILKDGTRIIIDPLYGTDIESPNGVTHDVNADGKVTVTKDGQAVGTDDVFEPKDILLPTFGPRLPFPANGLPEGYTLKKVISHFAGYPSYDPDARYYEDDYDDYYAEEYRERGSILIEINGEEYTATWDQAEQRWNVHGLETRPTGGVVSGYGPTGGVVYSPTGSVVYGVFQ